LIIEINEKNINEYRQNKIKYIIKDLEQYVPEDIIREVLLKRGVNKWFMCRGEFINLKDELKDFTNSILKIMFALKLQEGKRGGRYREMVGMLKTTICIRERIRRICHLSRWQFPE